LSTPRSARISTSSISVEHRLIELALDDEIGDSPADRRRRALEAAAEAAATSFAFLPAGRSCRSGSFEITIVIAVSSSTLGKSDHDPEEIVARLIYRDGLMLVIDKPAGLAVHKGPKGGESLEDYFDALRFGLPRPPALAHRLDRDTPPAAWCSVAIARRLRRLAACSRAGGSARAIVAVVAGEPAQEEGRIELPLGRKDATRGWWMKHDPRRPAGGDHVEGDGTDAGRRRA